MRRLAITTLMSLFLAFSLSARMDGQVAGAKELSITQADVKPAKGAGWETSILSDLITEDAHLMVFDYVP